MQFLSLIQDLSTKTDHFKTKILRILKDFSHTAHVRTKFCLVTYQMPENCASQNNDIKIQANTILVFSL